MLTSLKNERRNLLILLIVYFVSQGLILVVSGLWNDDWCIVNISSEGLRHWASELGKPEVFPIVLLMKSLPDFCYKFVIFISYYVTSICFYMICQKAFMFQPQESFWLTLLFLAVPANDVRIERLCIMYTLGLALFSIAFFILVYKYDGLRIPYRLLSLALFFCSFILNSLLVFMSIVWIYIILKDKRIKKILGKIDFFLVPFLYFIIDGLFFPAHGQYAGYNSVSFGSMISAPIPTFIAINALLLETGVIICDFISSYSFLMIIALFAVGICLNTEKCHNVFPDSSIAPQIILWEFVVGCIALFAGLFPYAVVRNVITMSGFNGRNAILSPIGFALILHALLHFCSSKKIRYVLIILMSLISTVHFSKTYVEYQRDYYYDRGLQVQLAQHPELSEQNTIVVVSNEPVASVIKLNGLFAEVYGNENRLVQPINSYDNILTGKLDEHINREWYNMTGYTSGYNKVDVVVIYSNSISNSESLLIRVREIFGEDISNRLILNSEFSIVYPEDERFGDYICQ